MRSLCLLPGGLGRFVTCSIGANHCRLWEKCGHGLSSRPRESASVPFLDELLGLFRYPAGSGRALLAGTLPLRYCAARFARLTPSWRLPVPGSVVHLVDDNTKHRKTTLCTIPIPVEFDRSMSVSSGSGADVDMRVCSKRGIVEVESAPSWVSALMERMDQRLDANERRIELRMDERLDTNERRIEQVLGLHQVRLDKHDVELSAQRRLVEGLQSEIGDFRRSSAEQCRQFSEQSSETSSTAGSTNSGEWCPRTVLVRGWAPFGSPASQKIDRVEYKKVANELLSCLPHSLQNSVMVRAPFAANFQISFGLKDGGGFDLCRAVQEALIAGVESNMITVRGHELKVSIEQSPRKKITSSNMHRAAAFLKKSGVSPESYLLCQTGWESFEN